LDQDLTQHVQAEAIEKSNAFEKLGSDIADLLQNAGKMDLLRAQMLSNVNPEFLCNLHQQTLDFFNQASPNGKMANNDEVVSDDGKMEQNEFIKAFTKVSIKDTIVSDGNDTETFTFGVINSENKVKNINFQIHIWTFSETSWCSDQNFRGLDVKTDIRTKRSSISLLCLV
jgi:hypothetical protein